MEPKIRNRIIAISGEPVSGKSTVVKELIEQLNQKGFDDENIHIISTGHQFRTFFSEIIEFIKNSNNDEKMKELVKKTQIKEIIQNKEYRGSLIRTIIGIKNAGINVDEIDSISQLNNNIIDDNTRKMGIEINQKERPNEFWIFDSRMAFDLIPEAFSVRLTINSKEAAKRLYNDSSRGKEDKYSSLEEAEKEREERRIGEIQRYKDKYGVDLENPENYDLIIDTSNYKFEEMNNVAIRIIKGEEKYREKLYREEKLDSLS